MGYKTGVCACDSNGTCLMSKDKGLRLFCEKLGQQNSVYLVSVITVHWNFLH